MVEWSDGLSPLLLNIVLEGVLQKVRNTNLGLEVWCKINILAFSDDATILTETKEGPCKIGKEPHSRQKPWV